MAALVEQDSDKAARILAVARDLLLRRGVKGVTVAEIAEKAHVGKGTVYLYWATKEDLFFGLFARDFLAAVDEEIAALSSDPDLVRPHRLIPRTVRTAESHPFVRALLTEDADVLGVLAEHPRSQQLLGTLGPSALMNRALPAWRQNRLARTDWPLHEQAYALRLLMTGFFQAITATATDQIVPSTKVDEPDRVMGAAVTALLGPEQASPAEVRATAEEGLRLMTEARDAALASITASES
ncbi:TetR/AcrR family transcriptional regulator [Goodfellowiella coeruleoviolacea]|uniref:Transcriptional regulator, TetR family n=1 Tax=Goodfellowiella coeruleoviolacea TaxID=334858 RepID=A0AAE3GJ06_9PSEU|nr:TetR/AcrR family transcriptional regulator [Goodfellowiella coeruleoviolacea]MCP2169096.1 transcriptional regulator, TetR family [Goodfellowiella coeruleoviolacea]